MVIRRRHNALTKRSRRNDEEEFQRVRSIAIAPIQNTNMYNLVFSVYEPQLAAKFSWSNEVLRLHCGHVKLMLILCSIQQPLLWS